MCSQLAAVVYENINSNSGILKKNGGFFFFEFPVDSGF
jgi:hypothetical protein